jgi:hypothetical protein
MEGREGVENLAIIVEAIGYEDPQYYGQFIQRNGNSGALGSIFRFLEDNSGAMEAIVEWIASRNEPEWKDAISDKVEMDEDEDSDEDEDEE